MEPLFVIKITDPIRNKSRIMCAGVWVGLWVGLCVRCALCEIKINCTRYTGSIICSVFES